MSSRRVTPGPRKRKRRALESKRVRATWRWQANAYLATAHWCAPLAPSLEGNALWQALKAQGVIRIRRYDATRVRKVRAAKQQQSEAKGN